jgi:hypothetical protein
MGVYLFVFSLTTFFIWGWLIVDLNSAFFIICLARDRRDITVPSGTASISAIS